MRRTYLCALTTIALLTIGAQVLVQVSLSNASDDAIEINFAGRQRMLSQRISKSVLLLERGVENDSAVRDSLREDLQTWVSAQRELREGSDRFPGYSESSPIGAQFHALAPVVTRVSERTTDLLSQTPDRGTQSLWTSEIVMDLDEFVLGMDRIVFDLDRASTEQVGGLRWLETALAIATLLVLAIEAMFVFEPAVRALRNQFARSERLREEAEAATNAKTQFLASMSHEIRTPMTAILGFTEILQGPTVTPADKRHAIRTIDRNAQHLLDLVNDLLDLSKAESGEMQLESAIVDLRQLIHDSIRICEPRARDQNTLLRLCIDGEIPECVVTDPLRIRQCAINLISNAIKFTPEGKVTVRLSANRDARRFRVAIEDTGCGIPEDKLGSIFQEYQQADASTARLQGGTGLGLAITRNYIDALGGRIGVDSEVGEGSVFHFELPIGEITTQWVTSPKEGLERATPVLDIPRISGRVLVVDDTADNRRLYTMMLKRVGLDVDAVSDGLRGLGRTLNRLESGKPYELILSDLEMPGLTGLEMTEQLREHGVETPILLLTADSSKSIPKHAREVGCDGVLAKPIRQCTLLREVANHMRKRDGESPHAESPRALD